MSNSSKVQEQLFRGDRVQGHVGSGAGGHGAGQSGVEVVHDDLVVGEGRHQGQG